jgi:hypothetical protein
VRSTTRGLAPGQPIRIAKTARRHSRGVVVRLFADRLEYRSDADSSLRLAPLADVHVRRPRTRRTA